MRRALEVAGQAYSGLTFVLLLGIGGVAFVVGLSMLGRGDALGLILVLFGRGALTAAIGPRFFFQKRSLALLNEIAEQRGVIAAGGGRLGGYPVTLQTEIVRYEAAVSVLYVSSRFSSPFLLVGRDNTALWQYGMSVLALLIGWWGIPWGPIFTIQALRNNLRGGTRFRLSELIAD